MKRKLIMAALLMAVMTLTAFPGDSQMKLVTFELKTVTDSADTAITWLVPSSGIYIQNDSDNTIYLRFGTGTVNTSTGAGGGVILPYQGAWFPIRAYRLALKCATGSANVRIWVWKP